MLNQDLGLLLLLEAEGSCGIERDIDLERSVELDFGGLECHAKESRLCS